MRKLKKEELDLIAAMLSDKPDMEHIIKDLSNKNVIEMDDGGMGSLLFVSTSHKKKKFGRQVALFSLIDIDGIPISFAVNFDKDGDIFELDVFKADYSAIKQFPLPPFNPQPPLII